MKIFYRSENKDIGSYQKILKFLIPICAVVFQSFNKDLRLLVEFNIKKYINFIEILYLENISQLVKFVIKKIAKYFI